MVRKLGCGLVITALALMGQPAASEDLFKNSETIDKFEIVCGEGDRVTHHWKLSDKTFEFFTKSDAREKNVIYSVKIDRAAMTHGKTEYAEWDELVIAVKGADSFKSRSLGPADLMTVRLATIHPYRFSKTKRWSTVNIEMIEANFDSNGYVRSVYTHKQESEGCSLTE